MESWISLTFRQAKYNISNLANLAILNMIATGTTLAKSILIQLGVDSFLLTFERTLTNLMLTTFIVTAITMILLENHKKDLI